jgi:L-lactate dehydrogenase (cytochrome)
MFAARERDQHLFFQVSLSRAVGPLSTHKPLTTSHTQIYLNKDRSQSEKLLRKVEKLGATAIIFTVDVMHQSKRTMDVRNKPTALKPPLSSQTSSGNVTAQAGVSKSISGYQDEKLAWSDITFIRVNHALFTT